MAVLGNHDLESGKTEEVCSILREAGVDILDGDAREIQGVGFAGVRGSRGASELGRSDRGESPPSSSSCTRPSTKH